MGVQMKSSKALSHTQYVLINRLSIPLGAFIILIIIGRYSDELLGQYALVMTFFYIMQMLPLLGLTPYIMREVARDPVAAGHFYVSIGFLSIIGCVLVDISFWFFFRAIEYPKVVVDAIFVSGILIFPGILAFIAEIIFMSLHRAKPVAQVALTENIFRVVLSVLVLWFDGGLIMLMWVFFITRSGAFIAYTWIMKAQNIVSQFEFPNIALLRKTLKILPSFLIGAVLFIILSRMDFVVLSLYEQVEVIGYYAVSYRLFDISIILLTALIMALFPWVSKRFIGAQLHYRVAVKNILVLFVACLVIASFIGIMFSEDYVSILFSKQYPHPVFLTQLFMAALLFAGMDFVASGILHASDKQTFDVKAIAIGGGVNIALLFWLIPIYGIYGAFVAKIVAIVLQCIIKFHYMKLIIGRIWSFKELMKLMLVVFLTALMVPLFLGASFIVKVIGSLIVVVVLVPLSMLMLGFFSPILFLRFYWRKKGAQDVSQLNDLIDIIVEDNRQNTKQQRKYNTKKEPLLLVLERSVFSIVLYRLCRYLWLKGNKKLALNLEKISFFVTKIHLRSNVCIGPGFVLLHPKNINITADVGVGFTGIGDVDVDVNSDFRLQKKVVQKNRMNVTIEHSST
jgi:O-antigen/teichoic acid export membrane protein